ncbi:MAG TPA: VTT domain-containing protein [Thermoanaerobaculia bacterium]|nr:VTT domain-containing protein [Thermoanaerobaculia bacterium]
MSKIVHLLIRYGTPLVWLNVFAEQIGLPIPAVPTLVVAGALSRDGKMSSTLVIAGAVAASLLADWFWFLLGRRMGYRVLRVLCIMSLSRDTCVRDTEAKFERWGMRSLIVAKFVPGFSTVAPPLAGATRQSTAAFLLYDGIGALLWAGLSVAAGHVFHRAVDRVLLTLENMGGWAIALLLTALALFMIRKWMQRVRLLHKLRLARITPEELHELMEDEPPPVIIDVRTPSAQKRDPRRVRNAVVMPHDAIPEHVAELPRNREVILYCT